MIMFSCGGRADGGEPPPFFPFSRCPFYFYLSPFHFQASPVSDSTTGGEQTDSQLFAFKAGETSLALAPNSGGGTTCLVDDGAKLGSAACGGAGQLFTIG